MNLTCHVFSMPKFGCSEEEYEDAFHSNEQAGLYSIADGATEASFSKEWANLVVEAFCRGDFSTRRAFERNLSKIQGIWLETISSKPLPWYAEEKVRSGAFCSFLGIDLKRKANHTEWQAIANGDCCLFQIRKYKIVGCFPFSEPDDFDNHPLLLSSNPARNPEPSALIKPKRGVCMDGDQLFLMTDALACWFLKRAKRGPAVINVMRSLDEKIFIRLINQERTEKDENQLPWLKNDDVTFLRIRVGEET